MSSYTDIGNNALRNIGASGTLNDWETDQSAEGKEVRRHITMAVNETLEEEDWSFARRIRALTVHDDDAPLDWAYRYVLFPDCLVPISISVATRARNSDPIDFDMVLDEQGLKQTLVTDTEGAILTYTSNTFVENPTRWTHAFERCVEHRLSYLLAISLKKGDNVIQNQYGLYQRQLQKAVTVNQRGRRRFTQQKPRSIRART